MQARIPTGAATRVAVPPSLCLSILSLYREGVEQLLLCEAIDVHITDNRGKTPQDYARDETIRDLFVEHMTAGEQPFLPNADE